MKIITPSLYISLAFLVVQQVIVGLSTYFIAKLAIDIAQHQDFLINLIGFVVSLIVVYVPAYLASVYLEKSKFELLDDYVQRFVKIFCGKTFLLSDKQLKAQSTVFVSQEGKSVIDDTLDFVFDGVALILNLSINVLILGFFLDRYLLMAYVCGFLLVEMFIFYHQKNISRLSTMSQKSRISFIATLNRIWDHVVIFNRYNMGIFTKIYRHHFERSKKLQVANQSFNHLISSLGMILFMLPVLGFISYLFIQNHEDYVFLALLVATLPRQIQLLQMGQALVFHQTNFSSIKAKLTGLKHSLNAPDVDVLSRIDFQRMVINDIPLSEFDLSDLPTTGRMTIRGCNGAGKSSLLLHLKTRLSGRAFYLPVSHDLFFRQNDQKSTGQKLFSQLIEIENHKNDVGVIILDEWDANLDKENKATLDELIDEIATSTLVVEVRH
ncbi:ABC transporter ATP-binding protein [Moraxella haemolytica]|uniref:ATP-binding cassette domain-containing protein n=1 Tax=Moraxella haemolytica TaxID=2904119 RepID=UPI002543F5D0|nr:ABC transporter ATP-binding protein [Moraxella sp. ZY171148]WII95640.1 ABC transporter ATP-binding protein [Moraxella sp. ZY171148]